MRVLHFFKTYLPDSVGGIEQVIFQLCESGAQHGIEGQVLTLSADPTPPVVQLGQHGATSRTSSCSNRTPSASPRRRSTARR